MGVMGLKTFLERENQTRKINIGEEVSKWMIEHPDETPIVAIPFLNNYPWVEKNTKDSICGGRFNVKMNFLEKKLMAIKSTGCSLIFLSEIKTNDSQNEKIESKLQQNRRDFDVCKTLYDMIDDGKTLQEIVSDNTDFRELSSIFGGLKKVAETYGDLHYIVGNNYNLDVVRYANDHNVMAIIAEDTDFLIFDGPWRLWSPHDLKITEANQITIHEYHPNVIRNYFSLSQNQLPLFATLSINTRFTKWYRDELSKFHIQLRSKWNVGIFRSVARYIRTIDCTCLSDHQIERISQDVMGVEDADFKRVINKSLESYNIETPIEPPIEDPFKQMLINTRMYRIYTKLMQPLHFIGTQYYDMRDFDSGATFMQLKMNWKKREIGLFRQRTRNDSYKFTVLAKMNLNEDFMEHTETPIYPDFPIPPLEQLYEAEHDVIKITNIKWKIFAWIMSLSDNEIAMIKQLPKDYMLISTALYTLVKNRLITVEEADGILYSEKMVYDEQTMNVDDPTVLLARHVRVAHLYSFTFGNIRKLFNIAGLKSFIQRTLLFDGVYFQTHMAKVNSMTDTEHEQCLDHIKSYRIYSEI